MLKHIIAEGHDDIDAPLWTRKLVIKYLKSKYSYGYLPPEIREIYNDEKIGKIAITNSIFNFKYFAESKKLCLYAFYRARMFDEGRDEPEYIDYVLSHLPDSLRSDPDILVEMMLAGKILFKDLPQELQNDEATIIKYLARYSDNDDDNGYLNRTDYGDDILETMLITNNLKTLNRIKPQKLMEPKMVQYVLKYYDIYNHLALKRLVMRNYPKNCIQAQLDIKFHFHCRF